MEQTIMTAVFEFDFARLSDAADEADERASDERWSRIRAVAAAISEADLNNFEGVIRAVYAVGLSSKQFMPFLDDAIQLAREARQ